MTTLLLVGPSSPVCYASRCARLEKGMRLYIYTIAIVLPVAGKAESSSAAHVRFLVLLSIECLSFMHILALETLWLPRNYHVIRNIAATWQVLS